MNYSEKMHEWAVIGAGPAGIAAVGNLLDEAIPAEKIIWLDPEFKVGDFGTQWSNVSSNTKVRLFLKYLEACSSFEYAKCPHDFKLNHLNPDHTCLLNYAAEPLQWVSDLLQTKVSALSTKVQELKLENKAWTIHTNHNTVYAKNVILATGSIPKNLSYTQTPIIPLQLALDNESLKTQCSVDDTIAVFGASHSAIMIIRSLVETYPVKKIINFYLSPLRFAVYLDNWILFDDTGLKGETAAWARENINGKLPDNLLRVYASPENVTHYLAQCNKAIHAVGFEKRTLPSIEGFGPLEYNPNNGIIAPGLFGVGIAFPEAHVDQFGTLEYRVGLWKFMDYLKRIVPIWMKYGA